jgi:phosphate transport system substrate-binding protein
MANYNLPRQRVFKRVLFVLIVSIIALNIVHEPTPTPTVVVDGSSSVYPITEAVAEDFQAAKNGAVRVTVGIAGTGGGFKRFCKGETDVSQASRPISESEIAACKAAGIEYIELPIAFDALTVAVSKKNTTLDCISVAQLKRIWAPESQSKIKRWSDVKPSWPNKPLTLYGAGSDSGTFDYFTEAVVGKAKSSRGDYTASEDDNVVVTGIANDLNALGYVPYAYYSRNAEKLKPLKVDGGKGCVAPSEETAQNGSYSPLARPLFLYVRVSAAQRQEIQDFIHFYLNQGAALVTEVGYLPFPATSYTKLEARFVEKKTGTVFGGHGAVSLSIHEILAREAVE